MTSFTFLIPETSDIVKWNHFAKLIGHRCRTLNTRCSCLGFNAREIRDETTVRSKEHRIGGSKKLRNVNEKLLQFPISWTKEVSYLQGDTENGLTPNRSELLFTVLRVPNFYVIVRMCKRLHIILVICKRKAFLILKLFIIIYN